MESRFNDVIHRIFYMLKLNTMVLLGLLCGGCFLSSMTAAVSEHFRAKGDTSLISFRHWWPQFLLALKETALISWLYNIMAILLLWALWFTSQFQGLIFFSAWLIQLAALILLFAAILAEAQLRQHYEGNKIEILKLSWIQLFMSPKTTLFTIGLWIIFMIVAYQMPAVAAFWSFGTWISFTSSTYVKEWRRLEII